MIVGTAGHIDHGNTNLVRPQIARGAGVKMTGLIPWGGGTSSATRAL